MREQQELLVVGGGREQPVVVAEVGRGQQGHWYDRPRKLSIAFSVTVVCDAQVCTLLRFDEAIGA
eukprot:SAG22_NODE_9073_length_611_cov_1.201172_1_plen_65_part_00